MRTASALSDHYATHAQLIKFDTHARFDALENVVDGSGSALKHFQKNVVNRHIGPMLCAEYSSGHRGGREHTGAGGLLHGSLGGAWGFDAGAALGVVPSSPPLSLLPPL